MCRCLLQADVLVSPRSENVRRQCSMRFQRMESSSHEHHARGDGNNEQATDFARGHALEAHATKKSCAGSACYEEIMRWKRMLRRNHALEAHATKKSCAGSACYTGCACYALQLVHGPSVHYRKLSECRPALSLGVVVPLHLVAFSPDDPGSILRP